jgi:hypothetical protein
MSEKPFALITSVGYPNPPCYRPRATRRGGEDDLRGQIFGTEPEGGLAAARMFIVRWLVQGLVKCTDERPK